MIGTLSRSLGAKVSRMAAAALAVAAAMLLPPVNAQAADAGALGGGGGGEFRIRCEPGDQLVGIDTMATHVIDFIAPVCGNRRTDPLATYGRPSVGGQVGTLRKPRCPPSGVVTILHVFIDRTPLVSRVGFTCWNIVNNAMSDSFADYGGESVNDRRLICPPGEIGVGIYGRAGTAIDQLGLICEPWQVAAVQPPPPIAVPGPQPGQPQPPPQGQAVTVRLTVELYNLPDGVGQKIGDLAAQTPGVTLLEPCRDNWCHVTWPGGTGWVFDGPEYDSLVM